MSKELVYLGRCGDFVRIALVDLEDLTPRTVLIKRVPVAYFSKMVRSESLAVRGFTGTFSEVEDTTYVRVAYIRYKAKKHHREAKDDAKIEVFISGAGKLLFFHPYYLSYLEKKGFKFVKRERALELTEYAIIEAQRVDIDLAYSDFYKGEVDTSVAFLAQKFLANGLWVNCDQLSGLVSFDVHPFINYTYTADTPYRACFEKLVLPKNFSGIMLYDVSLIIDALHVHGAVLFYSSCTGYARYSDVNKLYVYRKTEVNCTCLNVNYVISVLDGNFDANDVEKPQIKWLAYFSVADMLESARGVILVECFSNDDSDIDGDVIIPDDAEIDHSFNNITIDGEIQFGADVTCVSSFCHTSTYDVSFQPSKKTAHRFQIANSFLSTDIRGDLDISSISIVNNSFTGKITGNVLMGDCFRGLMGNCFCNTNLRSFIINTQSADESVVHEEAFEAGLDLADATLSVYGDYGDFSNCRVADLLWVTKNEKIAEQTFAGAYTMVTHPVPSIRYVDKRAFIEFNGTYIDFRLFPNLQMLDSRSVYRCSKLMTVIISGSVELSPSAFSRCPRLSSVFIGDDVRKVTASAFDNCATLITVYYGKNENVEKLRRLPRFKLVPNSVPEDALACVKERAEQIENAEVIADIVGIVDSISSEKKDAETSSISRATKLALLEKGTSSELDEKYPVIERCCVPVTTLSWASEQLDHRHEVETRRSDAARTLVAMYTAVYPFSDAVLGYTGGVEDGAIVLSGGGYSLVRKMFLVSGEQYYAYVVVDEKRACIIHAFTAGPTRDEVAENIAFMNVTKPDEMPSAILRYAEETILTSSCYSGDIYDDTTQIELEDAFIASWLPFGTFKLSGKPATLGVDLYSGSIIAYPWRSTTRQSVLLAVRDIFYRFSGYGQKYEADLSNLKPINIGEATEYLKRLAKNDSLPLKKEYDTSKIPLATDLSIAQKLLRILTTPDSQKFSVMEVTDLLVKSELFKLGTRQKKRLMFVNKKHECRIMLDGGCIDFYSFNSYALVLVQLRDASSGNDTLLTTPCPIEKIIDLLNTILKSAPIKDKNHYTIPSGVLKGGIYGVAACGGFGNFYSTLGYRSHKMLFCIGISTKSFKACLYATNLKTDTNVILFWFNSLSAAYEAAAEFNFNPFLLDSWTGERGGKCIAYSVDVSGGIHAHVVSEMHKVLRAGRDTGYIMQNSVCNQKVFDLACKQPKTAK